MSLPTCPSCGQSVLEDNAVDCPFCGAAMDGSRGAKNTPRPKANPVVNRPGARKMPENPAVTGPAASATPPAEVSKPPARPASGARGGKPVVDEDDPFGVGNAAAIAQAIQATEKPEKGRLHKVVCPMCEQVGFVPKSAVGKSVRCANVKCMVPVFTALDSTESPRSRKPARMSDEAEAARKAAELARPAKRNPLVIYGIVGGVLLVLTLVVLPLLTKSPDPGNLDQPVVIDTSKFGPDEEAVAAEAAAAAAKAKAAADAANPATRAIAHAKRMISLARQPTLRDKAWARRLTGDLYLRLNEPTQAAQEFNQLLVVQRSAGHYRIDPHLVRHWRAVAAGDTDTAARAFNDAMAELAALPKTGRLGLEAAMGLSAALVHAGKMDQALSLIAARQLDTTIAHNRDAIASTAWSFVAFRCRDASIAPPAVLEALLWINPLHTAVALDLAVHDQWDHAIAWSKATADSRALTDSLVAITDIAASQSESAEVFAKIEAAVASSAPVVALRVKGAVAAAQKDSAKLDACITDFAKLAPATPVPMPTANQLVQDDVVDRDTFLLQAIAVAEVVRAGVTAGKTEQAAAAMKRLESELAAVAPSATAVRILINEIANNEAAFRRQLATDLRVSDETTFNSMFRNYRRHLEQMARITEDRRLLQILLFSRVIRAGGMTTIQNAMAASPELTQDLLLDELSGLMAVSARKTNQQFPEVFNPNPSLKKGRATFGNAALIVNIAAAADKAWASHQTNLSASLKAMEKEAVSRNPLPGLCQAIASELVEFAALATSDPGAVLTAISQMQNGVWREESYIIAGRVFADRKIDDKADTWLGSTKIPAMEQIALLYGVTLGILERPVPTAKNPGDTKSVSQQADTGRR